MMKKMWMILILSFLFTSVSFSQNENSVAGDREALVALYNATNGSNWTNNNGWLSDNPSNDWYGITVNEIGRVTRIELFQNNLVGVLPNELGNLKEVIHFDVKHNYLTGQAPASIGQMEKLEWLLLGGIDPNNSVSILREERADYHPGKARHHTETNTFDGSILPPEWGQLKNIKIIEFSQTRVSGPLPAEWSGMTTLRKLFLNGKRISDGLEKGYISGPLPASWSTLVNLTNITLNDNPDITGPLPIEWRTWVNMQHFRIRRINLAGTTIPTEWETWTSIRLFYLSYTRVIGDLPAWILDDRSPGLNTLEISYSRLTGFADVDYSKVTKISPQYWAVGWNDIKAPFPSFAKQFRRLQIFGIASSGAWNNEFTGPMPDDFFENWDRLRNITLSGQPIGGTLPSSFGRSRSSASTQRLQFNSAGFVGKIPQSWGDYQSNGVYWLYLNSNELHGEIPLGFANWTWVVGQNGLRLHSNRFTYKDIIPLLQIWPQDIPLTYGTQKPFPIDEFIDTLFTATSGAPISLDLSAIHISGNVYQWLKDGNVISNSSRISGIDNHTLVISNSTSEDEGNYSLRITNPNAPGLEESVSKEIQVKLDGMLDLFGPVIIKPDN